MTTPSPSTTTLPPSKNWSLFHYPADKLRMTIEGSHSYPSVTPAWAAPLSHPDQFLSLLNAKGDEIAMVTEIDELSQESAKAVREELRRRYLTATILEIEHAKVEFGATYWTVRTERGSREMVTQSLQENAQWLTPDQLLLIDIDGNRFEIPNVQQLDPRSRQYLDAIL